VGGNLNWKGKRSREPSGKRIINKKEKPQQKKSSILEGVQRPRNCGTLFRIPGGGCFRKNATAKAKKEKGKSLEGGRGGKKGEDGREWGERV